MIQIIIAALGALAAIAGALAWWFRGRGDQEALKQERAYNAEVIRHQKGVRLSIREAEKRAAEGKRVADKALAGTLSNDQLRELRSGRFPRDG